MRLKKERYFDKQKKTSHGRSSVDDLWTTYLPPSSSGMRIGPGHKDPRKDHEVGD